ncbi:DUF2947 domain-containing protein [Shewanella gelidii]|uniref:DUF2947 family protein n=1 Tax=Shewanella gelidii TaxID=1642821 RepID=A0A917JJJ2_9GAMM|nr:DUF2947 domain-containing protein [Shewanella gelidii]MCL1096495.1 DUF2947 domain-containing protein [Shewanella gelidii]GGI67793.1 hypothetical protein GCM10009332_01240 [Shewanella gelidii]
MTSAHIPLAQYKRKWIFNHKDLPVSDEDKSQIFPLTEKASMQIWNQWISNKCSRPDQFSKGDWAAKGNTWQQTDHWQSAWDSEDPALPTVIAEFIQWQPQAKVYFCYDKYQVIETTWQVFERNWKCFLFFDDGPLLIAPKQKQAAWFDQKGQYQVGTRN